MLYICTKFHELSKRVSELSRNLISNKQISKEHNSVQNEGRVMVLVLCTSSDHVLYLYKVS